MHKTHAAQEWHPAQAGAHTEDLVRYINLKLAALGQPTSQATAEPYFLELAGPLLRNYHAKDQLLGAHLCPADRRIQAFLDDVLADVCPAGVPQLPPRTFVLDRTGLARVMSLPPREDRFSAPYLESYRVAQGVLHNPRSDRRTTQGIFHVVDRGLPVPADKIAVPPQTFAGLLARAFEPSPEVLRLPFTADQPDEARLWVSLLLRPLVAPAAASDPARTMEIRFFAPGSLVSNLDFVEGIFGNAGDPYLPEHDAALDGFYWTGHTGCIILAPHLVGVRKKDLGLPRYEQATERQRRDKMCWRDENESYNAGGAFKVTCRDRRGTMVTIIADSYYGYCKKEIKTQISFAANLFGLAEEEHAGGAIAFPSYVLGQDFYADRTVPLKSATFDGAMTLLGELVDRKPAGYAVDRRYPDVFYVPEASEFHVRQGYIAWRHEGAEQRLTLRAGDVYVLPSGYRLRLERQAFGASWRLVGTRADGTLIHKPSTVSGGGKSEISKSIASVLLHGPVFVSDYHADMDKVAAILARDYSDIFRRPDASGRGGRPILSVDRSLGSVIKLLTPSSEYTDEHNEWLRSLPQIIRQLVFTAKRYYQPDWGENWRDHFTVDRVNGTLGHELKYDNQKLIGNYLRVGHDPDGSWRIYKLRPDFFAADKVQVEDDITASAVLPRETLTGLDPRELHPSVKVVSNCEMLLFQRPDDAIEPGFDHTAEGDIASPGTFLSNYEPLTREQARAIVDNISLFDRFSEPMKRRLRHFVEQEKPHYVVCSAYPRMVDGTPSKNPRYQQKRPDLVNPRAVYLAEMGARLDRDVPAGKPVPFPVNSVLAGRRANPPQPEIGLPPLAVYGPVHYQELPELFIDFICSLTGKSPSTTGFGSEGALTKGPFNALPPVIDVNNAMVAAILTGYEGFTSVAGHVGPAYRVDHDISMLVPEIWCRMKVVERDPKWLIDNGYLEKIDDFEMEGRRVMASRLGYRITALFAEYFLGRLFETPDAVFPEALLRPETQDRAAFAAGVDALVEAQCRVAKLYFADGSVEHACPPVRALLHIMATGAYEGKSLDDPAIRALFTRESLLASSWYQERLRVKQRRDIGLWRRHVQALQAACANPELETARAQIGLDARLTTARAQLARVLSPEYLGSLVGTIGADPMGDLAG
jgi:phosphoenolpyruvate carboxykinase (diphosphate)